MPRNMSFALTTQQYLDGTKTVTRRLGWTGLQPGTILNGVKKSQGLKKGEKIQVLGQHRVISVRQEPLSAITQEEVNKEGFPDLTPEEFIDFFCEANDCGRDTVVNRIEFERMNQ